MRDAFASDATRSVIADWVELELLMSDRWSVTDADVVRAEGIMSDEDGHGEEYTDQNGEKLDREILQPAAEARRQEVWEELAYRQTALGACYPFVAAPTGDGGWQLRRRDGGYQNVRAARWTYIAALMMSSFRHRHVRRQNSDKAGYKALEKSIAKHFQALSALAASNLLGQVYWFGWPRPDKTDFRQALAYVIKSVGSGVMREKAPKNRKQIKDGSVDIVAWRSFGDRTYGALMLYGQVASGNNWRDKPIRAYLSGLFFDHFADPPSDQHLGATFIPFLLHTDLKSPSDGDMVGALVDEARQLEKVYGTVIDRLRITELVGLGLGDSEDRHNCPDPCETAVQVVRWVRGCRAYCDQVA